MTKFLNVFYRPKERRQIPRMGDSAGQALTEYILLMVFVLMVGLGAVYQFNTAFRVFADSYFGDYLSCLLKTGELPNLGSSSTNEKVCDSRFTPFDLNNGRRRISPNELSGQSGSSTPASNSSSSSSSNSKNSANQPTSEKSSLVADGNQPSNRVAMGSGGGTSGSGSSFGDGRSGRAPVSTALQNRLKSPVKNSGVSPGTDAYLGEFYSRDPQAGRQRYVPINQPEDDENFSAENLNASIPGSRGDEAKIVPINTNRKPVSIGEDKEMTFGDFMRYLLIAAIIIILLAFVGGQILQYSKSQEKG